MDLFSRICCTCVVALALCARSWSAEAAAAEKENENLLINPGFEQYNQGVPAGWSLFVLPQEGAAGSLDRSGRAIQGRNSVMLSTDTPYETDPFNNWSQNVQQDFAGKVLVLKGAIRTQDATDAALWVQCWRKIPWTMLASSGTSATAPIVGTMDWTRVEARLKAPRNTDYVTVRCVLKGTGKAWFDDLSLTTEAAKPVVPAAPVIPPLPNPLAAATAPEQPAAAAASVMNPAATTMSSLMNLLSGEAENPEATAAMRLPIPPIPPRPPVRTAPQPQRPEAPQAENKTVQELVNANRMLMESYQALQQTNAELGEQVKAQQKEIQALRGQKKQTRGAAKPVAAPSEVPAPAPAAPETPAPAPVVEPPPPPLIPSTTENN